MKFLAALLAWITLFAALLGAAVAFVDARGEFSSDRFPKVTLDARRLKMALFTWENNQRSITGLVLGSSRSMKIDPSLLDTKRGLHYFNLSVDAARAEDYLALYRWARERGAPIRDVLIGLDVEALNGNDKPFVNYTNNAELRAMVEQDGSIRVKIDAQLSRIKGLFTASYIRDSTKAVVASFLPEANTPFMQFTENGYLHYPSREARRRNGTFDLSREIKTCIPGYLGIYGEMDFLSNTRFGYLETLIREIQTDGGRAEIWITPLHPLAVQVLVARTSYDDLLNQTRTALEALSNRTGVPVKDFSVSAQFVDSNPDWYDCAHVDERGAAYLVDRFINSVN